ncbi:MAG: recombinase family protein [Alphaproteobacteria bacterium]
MKYVAYYRVSTDRQGRSGLGLEAQQAAVSDYVNGKDWEIVDAFTEVERGGNNARPKLDAALRSCRLYGATLVVAKLDRLSRDAAFLLTLQNSKTRFVAADLPEANEMTVGIMAVVAQQERRMISERTKAALRAAKARGKTLGSPGNLSEAAAVKGRALGTTKAQQNARERWADLRPIIDDIRSRGASSLRAIANELNERGIPSARGGRWHPQQVKRVLQG